MKNYLCEKRDFSWKATEPQRVCSSAVYVVRVFIIVWPLVWFLAVYDVLYICVDDTIYYHDDFISTMTIDCATCTNMGFESDVSGHNC